MTAKVPIEELPQELRFAFAPLIKRAMGFAIGATFGLGVFLVTAGHLIAGAEAPLWLWLLDNYFMGFDPETWTGAFIGLFWGFWAGFVMGWFFAACRNFMVAVWLLVVRAKAQLAANRDFLDHI